MSSRSTIDLSEALATLPVVHWTTRSVIAYSLETGTSEDYARYCIPFGTAFGSFGQWHRVTAASPRFGRALPSPEAIARGIDADRSGANAGKRRRASSAPHATTSR